MSPEIVVPFVVFGTPVALVFISKYFKFREKQLEASMTSHRLPAAATRQEHDAKQKELEARIENLESILISLDSDLEHRLAVKKSGSLPEGASAAPLSARATPSLLPSKGSADDT